MATLIFQIDLRQWEKNQHNVADTHARNARVDKHPIASQPQYVIFDTPCIIDQHGAALPSKVFPNGRIKTALLADGSVSIDRFLIRQSDGQFIVSYQFDNQPAKIIGNLQDGWLQARYRWRYREEMSGEIFWRYEELILNAGYAHTPAVTLFLDSPPAIEFVDDALPPAKP